MKTLRFLFIFLLTVSFSFGLIAQNDIYWVGGTGDWDDLSMWHKNPEGESPAGIIPTANHIAHFTEFSSETSTWTVNINTGSYDVHSISVETEDDFTIMMNGTDNNEVEMSVFGDIDFASTHSVEYASDFILNNKWIFEGATVHNVTSGGHDLFNIEMHNEAGTFNQLDDLEISARFQMFAGIWNSNSHDITAGKLLFEDDEPSSSPLTKLFNSESSIISCDEWESGFTYGSLTVTGNHVIKVKRFRGSPKQTNGSPFSYHEIILLEYPDVAVGTPIEYNNFECRGCIIESITIEDTGDTKLADEFTVNGKLIVKNFGSSILFNGGNSRNSEVTFNGEIITPKRDECDEPFTIFSSIHTDESLFIRTFGTLQVEDAIMNNIETAGGASFDLARGVLQGASSGWNITGSTLSFNFYWRPPANTTGNWDDPNNWEVNGGSNEAGCIPSIADNVFIDGNSNGDMRIPRPYNAECKDFIWTNKDGLELTLDGTNSLESSLSISGNIDLDQSATITPVNIHEIYLTSTTDNSIRTNGVSLPEVQFIGTDGSWTLLDDLDADILTFEAGTFNSNDHDVVTDVWNAFEEYAKIFNFGSSEIRVNGIMDLAEFPTRNVTVNAGTSTIKCEVLNCIEEDLYNVQLNNSNTLTLNPVEYKFNSLILNGTGEVLTANDFTTNNLIFQADGSSFAPDPMAELTIDNRISSLTSVGNPGILKSKTSGTQVDVNKASGNLCVTGNVGFVDVNSNLQGVLHAPDGIDLDNNSEIVFEDGASSNTLYWVAENGGVWQQESNWSRVDGGCPDTKDPSNSLHLEFNRNSFSISTVTVNVPISEVANIVTFKNAENLTINSPTTLEMQELIVDGGFANFTGKNLDVSGTTEVKSSGFLTTNMDNFITNFLETISGVYIVKSGSDARLRD